MYLGLTLSLAAHALLLGWALVSFQSTPPLKVKDPEPVEVAIISPDELVRLTKGDRSSKKLKTRPAKQAETPPQKKKSKRVEVRSADALPPPPAAEPEKDDIAKKLAALSKPKPPPGPTPEEIAAAKANELALKKAAEAKKKAEQEKKRKAREAKKKAEAEKKRKAAAARKKKLAEQRRRERARKRKLAEQRRKKKTRDKFIADQKKALANLIPDSKAPDAGSPETKPDRNLPRGTQAGAPEGRDSRLTASQRSMIGVMMKQAVRECWNINSGLQGIQDVVVEVEVRLRRDGRIDGTPRVVNSGRGALFNDAANSAIRALLQCQPYSILPAEYYNGGWDFMVVEFDPRKMF